MNLSQATNLSHCSSCLQIRTGIGTSESNKILKICLSKISFSGECNNCNNRTRKIWIEAKCLLKKRMSSNTGCSYHGKKRSRVHSSRRSWTRKTIVQTIWSCFLEVIKPGLSEINTLLKTFGNNITTIDGFVSLITSF